jgi:glycosyltransferase involved in cell wall biosynthesis
MAQSRGGPTYAINLLSEILGENDFSCSIVTLRDESTSVSVNRSPKAINYTDIFYVKKLIKFYSFSPTFFYWLDENVSKFDLVHIHGIFNFPSVSAGIVCYKHRIPYIITLHGMANEWGMKTKKYRKLISFLLFERNLIKNAQAIHLTSIEEHNDFKNLKISSKTVTIPIPVKSLNSSNNKILNKKHSRSASKTVIFIGRIHPIKNLESLIYAIYDERLSNFTLLICGDGDINYIKKLKQLAKKLGLEARVIWHGFINEDKKLSLLQSSDLLALPSFSESFGISAIEALSAGLPLVLNKNVANAKNLGKAKLAFVCDESPASIAEGMLQMADKKSNSFSRKATTYFSRHFNETFVANEMSNLYKRIINNTDFENKDLN